jgi:hypothetical protein
MSPQTATISNHHGKNPSRPAGPWPAIRIARQNHTAHLENHPPRPAPPRPAPTAARRPRPPARGGVASGAGPHRSDAGVPGGGGLRPAGRAWAVGLIGAAGTVLVGGWVGGAAFLDGGWWVGAGRTLPQALWTAGGEGCGFPRPDGVGATWWIQNKWLGDSSRTVQGKKVFTETSPAVSPPIHLPRHSASKSDKSRHLLVAPAVETSLPHVPRPE